jgi:hypothetical protein
MKVPKSKSGFYIKVRIRRPGTQRSQPMKPWKGTAAKIDDLLKRCSGSQVSSRQSPMDRKSP